MLSCIVPDCPNKQNKKSHENANFLHLLLKRTGLE